MRRSTGVESGEGHLKRTRKRNEMEKKRFEKGFWPLCCLLAAFLITAADVYAQFGGFGMGMPGMPDMGNMFPKVKHTMVEQLKRNYNIPETKSTSDVTEQS